MKKRIFGAVLGMGFMFATVFAFSIQDAQAKLVEPKLCKSTGHETPSGQFFCDGHSGVTCYYPC